MAFAFLTVAHDNWLTRPGITVTPPTSLAGRPFTRAYDGTEILPWSPSGANATESIKFDFGPGGSSCPDYMLVAGSNMDELGVGVSIFYSDDDILYTIIFATPALPGAVQLWTEDPARYGITPHRYWRYDFTGIPASGFQAGEISTGRRVKLRHVGPVGFDPLQEDLEVLESRTEAGYLLRTRRLAADRINRFRWKLVPGAQVDLDHPFEGFRYFWENHASLGKPFACGWAGSINGAYMRDCMFAVADQKLSRVPTGPALVAGAAVDLTVRGPRGWRLE